jgi:hypothetical protein
VARDNYLKSKIGNRLEDEVISGARKRFEQCEAE